jgi:flagellar basal body-associated protein FliL
MIKYILKIIVLLCVVPMLHASSWEWQKTCNEDTLSCEVWFNQQSAIDTITAKDGTDSINVSYESYTKSEDSSAIALVVQTHLMTSSQLTALKISLISFVEKTKLFQKTGLFQVTDSLSLLSTIGTEKAIVKKQTNELTVTPLLENSAKPALDVLQILGGSPVKRKSLFWLTTDTELSIGQIREIKTQLTKENTRLVVIHLQLSELSVNNANSLQKLTQESNGLFVSIAQDKWRSTLSELAGYTNNGGVIILENNSLCGQREISFEGQGTGPNVNTTWNAQFRACNVEPTSEISTETVAGTEVDTTARTEVETEAGTEVDTTARTEVETAAGTEVDTTAGSEVETTAGTEVDTTVGSEVETTAGTEVDTTVGSEVETTADTEIDTTAGREVETTAGTEVETTAGTEVDTTAGTDGEVPPNSETKKSLDKQEESNSSNGLLIIIAGAGLLLCFLLIIILRNKSSKRKNETPYAVIIEFNSNEEIQHNLLQNSVTLGRDFDCNIILKGDSVSGKHALIKRSIKNEISIVDTMSTNGIKVNDKVVSEKTLQSGDVILFGDSKLRIDFLR